ncbi:zinc-binding alcohol dehydrogenase [Blyttiomyces helicus]|uniref:Zinc-binding alcohol dehydrogenase n=1 Tax=Blyttiomyces helicus TaxID=388810 RepID=A0A4V1IPZ7_9FUNG|nr:zinc-binding alcohol dehydrogenase [Blyttiomyces helicus]|eukprot:RKO84797.1 zinc-binding alcohol dehydrogenase [Blyttiomyces helicus]
MSLPTTQTAIAQLVLGGADTLQEVLIPVQKPTGRDILVSVKAVSVNPVDYMKRSGAFDQKLDEPLVLGYDASGVVEAVGEDVKLFKKGDEVMYAGAMTRSGSNAPYQIVDERIVAAKPKTWSYADSAALPLVGLTAWEALVDNMGIPVSQTENPKSLLVINGAGGVGTVALTLASKVLKLKTIIATASRPETIAWTKKFGATHVINHTLPLGPQLTKQGLTFDYVFIYSQFNLYFFTLSSHPPVCGGSNTKNIDEIVPLINPLGKITSILGPDGPIPLQAGMLKSISFHWTAMFTKALFNARPETQGQILKEIAALADAGVLSSDLVTERHVFNVDNLKKVHAKSESGKAMGKIVLERA